MEPPWVVEFWVNSNGRPVLLNEIRGDLTNTQFARLTNRIGRLKEHGWRMDADYFGRVAGSKLGLGEFRLTLEKLEYRLLFSLESQRTYVMLTAYKEKRGSIPRSKIEAAEQRLLDWRGRRHED